MKKLFLLFATTLLLSTINVKAETWQVGYPNLEVSRHPYSAARLDRVAIAQRQDTREAVKARFNIFLVCKRSGL